MTRLDGFSFQGAGLDRAAHLRADAARLLERDDARVVALWRGKPLVTGDPSDALGWVPPTQAGLLECAGPLIFLGLMDGAPRFARDLSAWMPDSPDMDRFNSFADASEQVHPGFPEGMRFAELRSVMTRLSAADAEFAAMARAVFQWHDSHGFCAKCGAASVPVNGGWQRGCDTCGTQHYPRTDPVVIMLITRGNSVLVGRSPGWPEGMYSLLAGFVEPGETPEAAVRREVFEESGIRVGPVRYLASQPWPFPTSLMTAWSGEALDEKITLDPVELEAARWITREEMAEIFRETHPEISAPRRGAIARAVLEHWLADRLDQLGGDGGAAA